MTSINLNQPSMNLHTEHPQFRHNLYKYINHHLPQDRPIVVLCIGTDRSTGDSLGPLVGYFLEHKPIQSLHIYGTVDEPIHAKNIKDTVQSLFKIYEQPYIIAIDAALSSTPKVKSVDVGIGALSPGAALNKKELSPVGDLFIKGYINVSGFMEFSILQNTRLSVVMNMSKLIAQSLYYLDLNISKNKPIYETKLNNLEVNP